MSSSKDTTPATTVPATPAINSNVPFNVEESRDKRLQRTQSRVRDRGGIFKPTQRSTLLDILLGKSKKLSPVKSSRRSRSRSVSSSPVRRKSGAAANLTEDESILEIVPKPKKCRKSVARKSVSRLESEEPVAGPSSPTIRISKKASASRKGRKKTISGDADKDGDALKPASKSRGRKSISQDKANVTKNKETVAPDAPGNDDDDDDVFDTKKTKKSSTRKKKPPSKSTSASNNASTTTKKRSARNSKAKGSQHEADSETSLHRGPKTKSSASLSKSKKMVPEPAEVPPTAKADSRWQLEAIAEVEEDEEGEEAVAGVHPPEAVQMIQEDEISVTQSSKAKGKARTQPKTKAFPDTKEPAKPRRKGKEKPKEMVAGKEDEEDDGDDRPLAKARRKRSEAVKSKSTYAEQSDREDEETEMVEVEKKGKEKEKKAKAGSQGSSGRKPTKKSKEKPAPAPEDPDSLGVDSTSSESWQMRQRTTTSANLRTSKSRLDGGATEDGKDEIQKGKVGVAKGKSRKRAESRAETEYESGASTQATSSSSHKVKAHRTRDEFNSKEGEAVSTEKITDQPQKKSKLSSGIADNADQRRDAQIDGHGSVEKEDTVKKQSKQPVVHMDFSAIKHSKRRREDTEQLVITKKPKVNHEPRTEDVFDKGKPKARSKDDPGSSYLKKRRREDIAEPESDVCEDTEGSWSEGMIAKETMVEPARKKPKTGKAASKSHKDLDSNESPSDNHDDEASAKTRLKTVSRKQKENATSSKGTKHTAAKSTSKTKSTKTKAKAKAKGPPKSVLDQIRKKVNVRQDVDDEPDEIDFLS